MWGARGAYDLPAAVVQVLEMLAWSMRGWSTKDPQKEYSCCVFEVDSVASTCESMSKMLSMLPLQLVSHSHASGCVLLLPNSLPELASRAVMGCPDALQTLSRRGVAKSKGQDPSKCLTIGN